MKFSLQQQFATFLDGLSSRYIIQSKDTNKGKFQPQLKIHQLYFSAVP